MFGHVSYNGAWKEGPDVSVFNGTGPIPLLDFRKQDAANGIEKLEELGNAKIDRVRLKGYPAKYRNIKGIIENLFYPGMERTGYEKGYYRKK